MAPDGTAGAALKEACAAVAVKTPPASPLAALEVRAFRRRWLVLALFVAVMGLNALPWMQYTVIEDVATRYYGVSNTMVEWTTMVYNATAMLLVFPAAWMLDRYGLRASMLIGASGTFVGLWLKVAGCWPDGMLAGLLGAGVPAGYWVTLLGQVVVSASTNFIISAPTRLAAVWFPAHEVSTALGAGLMGQMGGISLGCALAPMTARSTWSDEDNFKGFLQLNLSLAVSGTVLLLAIIFLFQDAPPLPPSPAQASAKSSAQSLDSSDFLASMRRICRDVHFMLLLASYTLLVSVFIAITTLLNRAVLQFFPDRGADAGWLATLITVTGMGGILVISTALDRTKWFKELSVAVYAGSLATCVMYTAVLSRGSIEMVYWVSAGMGVFMTSFFVSGLEMAAELTYPEPEGNPTSLINWMFQPFALLVTLAYGRLFTEKGADTANYFLCGLLALGLAATIAIPRKYHRLQAETAMAAALSSSSKQPGKQDAASQPAHLGPPPV